jgi:hypothetical protein
MWAPQGDPDPEYETWACVEKGGWGGLGLDRGTVPTVHHIFCTRAPGHLRLTFRFKRWLICAGAGSVHRVSFRGIVMGFLRLLHVHTM